MNKKIKVIELLNKIANGEEVPKRIMVDSIGFKWDKENKKYIVPENGLSLGETFIIDEMLNDYAKILEDNTEEIEELEYYYIGQEKSANLTKIIDKIEELRVAVNKLRKEQK